MQLSDANILKTRAIRPMNNGPEAMDYNITNDYMEEKVTSGL